jgi:hypothetical protein
LAIQGLEPVFMVRAIVPLVRALLVLCVAAVPGWLQAAGEFVTANFHVYAPTQQIAQKVGEYAERWRREKALEWIGREMPRWGKRCPLQVTITPGGSSGETTFAFDNGSILDQNMQVSGSLERVLNSVLPHEITHTVFAYKFRAPLPRWADEGGSVLSEDDHERQKHDKLIRDYLAKGNQAYRLRTLMTMMQYPRSGEDVITLYAEGYSVVRFLVESSSKPAFLDFLGDAMQPQLGWDRALQKHYGLRNIEQLEQSWLKWMMAWCSPQARLNGSATGAGTTIASNQGQGSRAISEATRSKPSETVIRGSQPDEVAANRPSGQQIPPARAWSPVEEGTNPSPATPPGWKPLRATLGQPMPN